jgi:drug/metabolite transporter (DMT)-like permease
MLVALYYRITGLDRSLPFAGLALLLAAIFALATETLVQRERRPGLMAVGAMFATGTLAALALALTFALEKGWLTIALTLMVPSAAWIAQKRAALAALARRHRGRRCGGADRP